VAREVYKEGLRIPPMKLAEEGRLNDTLIGLIRENVRLPEQTPGDLHANIAANQTGARLIVELMDEHDLKSLDAVPQAICRRSEAVIRQEIQRIPDGRYHHSFSIEGFDGAIDNINIYFSSGGVGARADKDGIPTTMGPSNVAVTSVETFESGTGLLVRCKELRPDSGGPGQFRGGIGQRIEIQQRSAWPAVAACCGNRTAFPAAGYLGGRPGALRELRIEDKPVHPKGRHVLYPGEQYNGLFING